MIDEEMKLILAPMAGFSDQPFRRLCKKMGADEVVTELLSSNALVRDHKRTFKMAEIHQGERPASIQIFGRDPSIMAESAMLLEPLNPLFIDVNMGCPVKKVVKNGAGSALLENPKLAGEIVKKVVDAVKCPISVKIRTGKNAQNKTGFDTALAVADNGAKRITIHARTVAEHFSGEPDFEFVAKLRKRLSIELIGNGGINSYDDTINWIKKTGVDGLMIGRGAVGYPSIFKSIQNKENSRTVEELETIMLHISYMEEFYHPKQAIGPMVGHLMQYSKGIIDARKFRSDIASVGDYNELKKIAKEFFSRNLQKVA